MQRLPLILKQFAAMSRNRKSLFFSRHFHGNNLLPSLNEREREGERDGFLVQLFSPRRNSSLFSLLSTENWAPLREIRSPNFWLWYRVSGGCDGVLHFRDSDGRDLLWMPSQNQFKVLPPSNVPRLPHASLIDFKNSSFGFDSISHDFKVVRFVRHEFGDDFRNPKFQVELYSLKNDSWKEILHVPKQWDLWGTWVYVNGRYYWRSLWAKHHRNIVSFDFITEKFSQIALPPKIGSWELLGGKYRCMLVESDGKLGIIIYCTIALTGTARNSFELWVLQDYGSWTRGFEIHHLVDVMLPLLYSSHSGVLFFEGINNELMVYDFRIGKLKKLGIYDQHLQVIPYHVSSISVPWKCTIPSVP